MRRIKKGFTLIELLVIIAIIGVLATIVLVNVGSARVRSRDARRKADLKGLSTAISLYRDANGDAFPPFTGCDASTQYCTSNYNSTGDWPSNLKTSLSRFAPSLPLDPRNSNSAPPPKSTEYFYFYGKTTVGDWPASTSCQGTGAGQYVLYSNLENPDLNDDRNNCGETPKYFILLGSSS